MAEHVSTIMLCTVDTPTRNLADSVLNESPVAKKLKYINKFSNLYDFVDQFKSNSYWSPTGSPATAIGNLLCTPLFGLKSTFYLVHTGKSTLYLFAHLRTCLSHDFKEGRHFSVRREFNKKEQKCLK